MSILDLEKVTIGRYRGRRISQVPTNQLYWLWEQRIPYKLRDAICRKLWNMKLAHLMALEQEADDQAKEEYELATGLQI